MSFLTSECTATLPDPATPREEVPSPAARLAARADSPRAGARRVLCVAYLFPPVGGAGVQRSVKFVKYLPQCGWQPSVLTVANPSVPLYDKSLAADVPADTLIRRARTWEPSYAVKTAVSAGEKDAPGRGPGLARRLVKDALRRLGNLVLQPDPQILWVPSAVREGMRLLREVPHAAILATAPPFSSFLVAAILARRTGLPLVLDYRDEWTLSNAYYENKKPDRVSEFIQRRMQKAVVRSARALLATTACSARALDEVRAAAGSDARVSWIYNGYDPADFPAAPAAPRPAGAPFRIAYVGTLWNLTDVAPLVGAVQDLARRRPDLAARLELVFAGRRTGAQEEVLAGLKGLPCRVVAHPYLDHRAALELVRSADALCVLLSDVPGAERVVPAKIFEYMATKQPVLAIAPRGEVWDLLKDYPAGHAFAPADTDGIAAHLARRIAGPGEGGPANFAGWDGSRYDRLHQAGQLAELLESLA